MRSFISAVLVAAISVLGEASITASTHAQSARSGIVTTLEGRATVARISLASPAPLKFKDDIYTQDRISTDEDSLVRVLLGGKALITIRERSIVTIREIPGVATIKVGGGRVKVDVLKEKMRSGETVDIVTPNAVAIIRGTVVVAEVDGPISTLTVLTGRVDVLRIDPASEKPVGAPVSLGAMQQMSVIGTSPLPTPRTLTPEGAQQLGADFKVAPKTAPHGGTSVISSDVAISAASNEATAIVLPGAIDGGDAMPTSASGGSSGGSGATTLTGGGSSVKGVQLLDAPLVKRLLR